MSNEFSKYAIIKALNAAGEVISLTHNKPVIDGAGKLSQASVAMMNYHFSSRLGAEASLHDIVVEHHPLEGDYGVNCPSQFMSDTGVAYALAAIMGWKSPLNGAEIIYKNGELTVNNPFSITNLDAAFTPFKPQEDLAMAMAILLKFKVSIHFGDRDLSASFGCSMSKGKSFSDDPSILRELCRRAVDNSYGVIPDSAWDGTIPLSLVDFPKPEPVAETASNGNIVTD